MKRVIALLPVLIAFQAGAPPALAWTWPADGPVLRPFVLGDDPYAGGQHRGADIAAPSGTPVRAPAAGIVSFTGSVPGGGRAVTVQTADGYSVTLVHLGSIAVARESLIGEGATVGTIGPSGDAEHEEPYVHLGIRVTSDPNGYLDPIAMLPPRQEAPPPPAPPPVPADPVPTLPPVDASKEPTLPKVPAPASEPPEPDLPAVLQPAPTGRGATVSSTTEAVVPRARPVRREVEVPGEPDVQAAPALPGRTLRGSFELPVSARGVEALPAPEATVTRHGTGSSVAVSPFVVGAAGLAVLAAAGLALARRQLGDARPADAPALVLDDRAGRSAEDAGAARPAEEDRLVLDGDLERVALGQPKAFSDLDRDDDPSELVKVANDPCRRPGAAVGRRRFHRVSRHPPSPCRRAETISAL